VRTRPLAHKQPVLALLFAVPMALAPFAPSPALANWANASQMKYSNVGTYSVTFTMAFKRNGTKCVVVPQKNTVVGVGGSVSLDLTIGSWRMREGEKEDCLVDGKHIEEGTEVWGRIDISAGPYKSCRKDKAIIYRKSGGTVKYVSGGTTHHNNRCKIASWP